MDDADNPLSAKWAFVELPAALHAGEHVPALQEHAVDDALVADLAKLGVILIALALLGQLDLLGVVVHEAMYCGHELALLQELRVVNHVLGENDLHVLGRQLSYQGGVPHQVIERGDSGLRRGTWSWGLCRRGPGRLAPG